MQFVLDGKVIDFFASGTPIMKHSVVLDSHVFVLESSDIFYDDGDIPAYDEYFYEDYDFLHYVDSGEKSKFNIWSLHILLCMVR